MPCFVETHDEAAGGRRLVVRQPAAVAIDHAGYAINRHAVAGGAQQPLLAAAGNRHDKAVVEAILRLLGVGFASG